jgi:prepilin-type N-terminal cleavage/methylation domain-containing protein
MKKTISQKGFTLIELIIVMVILGIMAAVAVPRYLDSIANAEASAEDAVISAIRGGLKQAANDSLYTNGRASWPTNPFDALAEKPLGYETFTEADGTTVPANVGNANKDGEWTFNTGTLQITHQRDDNSRHAWDYVKGTQTGDNAEIGTLEKADAMTVAP